MGRVSVSVLVMTMLMMGSLALTPEGGDCGGGRGPTSGEDYPVWTDPLDDLSHVYMPGGGLVGVEVTGGGARLLAGEDHGWMASSVISAEPGYRYDFVVLDASTPGNSTVQISLLDATREAGEVGYANETIPGKTKVNGTYLSAQSIDPGSYPEIRIQVNLVADGADRPVVNAWSLYFVEDDEWMDDILGPWKMEVRRGLNFTDGGVEINLTDPRSISQGGPGGILFPPVAVAHSSNSDVIVFNPNEELTDYEDYISLGVGSAHGVTFGDLDSDGEMDLIVNGYQVIKVRFGDGTGNWPSTGELTLSSNDQGIQVDCGDFNGDGEMDFGFTQESVSTGIFLNQGGGSFNTNPDISLTAANARGCAAGDLNGDGYDDFIASDQIFFGGPDGPNASADMTLTGGTNSATYVRLWDVDLDGNLDVLLTRNGNGQTGIWLGGEDGPDSTMDYELVTPNQPARVCAGDINDDGFQDIVIDEWTGSNDLYIFPGSQSGWSSNNKTKIISMAGNQWGLAVYDIDQDGYDDIIVQSNGLKIFFGGDTWPTTPGITKSCTMQTNVIELAVDPEGRTRSRASFVTEEIDLPKGKRWDILDVEASVPANTSVTLCIRDGTGRVIEGFRDLTDLNVDLSTIDPDHVTTIEVVVNLWTEFNNTTPSVDLVRVRWMDRMTWREQFYGDAKIAGLAGLGVRDGELRRAHEVGGPSSGSYLGQAFGPDVPRDAGSFHTLRYSARLGSSQSGKLRLVDASTSEVLAETQLLSGDREWNLEGAFSLKDHPSIRVNVTAEGLDVAGEFALDDLWINWTERLRLPPRVLSLNVSEPSVYRLQTVILSIGVEDEYDLPGELLLNVEHRANGSTTWFKYLLGSPTYNETGGVWLYEITPGVGALAGVYDFRIDVTDTDMLYVDNVEFLGVLEVLNNLPTTPIVHISPQEPSKTSQLRVEFDDRSTDLESPGLEYRYLWFRDGELMTDLTGDIVDPSHTAKGQNWSVEVRAFDGEDEGEPGLAWVLIGNAAPVVDLDLPDPEIDEDTADSDWLDLSTAFKDPDGDALTWTVPNPPEHITLEIDPVTGKVTLEPEENWNGEENITFVASDGEDSAWQTITVYVTAVNDIPWFEIVNGEPVGDGPVDITIKQGELLSIDVLVLDVEGDDLVYDLNTTLFTIDGSRGSIRWQPDNDAVGTLRFRLTVWDVVTPSAKASLDFIVEVENENDPMEDPHITAPADQARFDEGVVFSLIATCFDPDTRYGQVLNYSWSSNMSGHLGYGPSLGISLDDVGTHVITLTVTDGEFQRTATVTVVIKAKTDVGPPPDGDGDGEEEGGINYALVAGIIAVLVVVGVLIFVVRTRKHAEQMETADEEEYKREHMERAYEAVKAAADRMEAEREEASKSEEWVPMEGDTAPSVDLSIEARETEAASAQTMALFGTAADEPVMSEEEQEQLRLDNLKRKYQNAIGRLPYGIPSKKLADMDWVELANALATGEKKTVEGGQEVTEIDGRWYYSDDGDTGTFLKEHGAGPKKEGPKRAEVEITDKAELLAKLEERFILGEISEEAYRRLVQKYKEE